MSRDIEDTPNPPSGLGLSAFGRGPGCGSGRPSGGLAVAAWVEGELAQELAGGGVDDADAQVLDEQDDVGSGVSAADADVVELAGVAEGDVAGGVDDVAADAVVGVGVRSLTGWSAGSTRFAW